MEVINNSLTICIPSNRDISYCENLILQIRNFEFTGKILIIRPNILDEFQFNDSNTRILYSTAIHATSMRNLAIKNTKTEWILFFDDDLIIDLNYFINLKKYLNDEYCIVQGCPYLSHTKGWLALSEQKLYYRILNRYLNPDKMLINICDARNLLIRTKIIEKFNFNENLLYAGEGNELANKLISNGYHINYGNDLYIYHFNRTKIKELVRQKISHGRGRRQLLNISNNGSNFNYIVKSLLRHFAVPVKEVLLLRIQFDELIYLYLTNTCFWIGFIKEIHTSKNNS